APSTSRLCSARSSCLTETMVIFACLPNLQGCLPVLQFSASAAASAIVAHSLSSNFLNWSTKNSCTLGSKRFHEFRLTAVKRTAQPSDIGYRCVDTSPQPPVLPLKVPVTAQSITPRCSDGTTSGKAMLTPVAPMPSRKSTIVLLNTR